MSCYIYKCFDSSYGSSSVYNVFDGIIHKFLSINVVTQMSDIQFKSSTVYVTNFTISLYSIFYDNSPNKFYRIGLKFFSLNTYF